MPASPNHDEPRPNRGTLRVYLGPAPGVGKTYAMLDEGWRRRSRGADVVIGLIETHGRANTADMIRDLEIVPRRRLVHRGSPFEEMDVDAIIRRAPQVALIDEMAHTNVPGSRNEKRWQDVEDILTAGIDVITTINIQHLESVNDVIGTITGVPQRETIPDRVVRAADQIELVDMSPEAIRRRLAHGNIYPPEKIDAALTNFFRPGNLGALREIALLWTADRVDEALLAYRRAQGIAEPWEAKERVVVAISGEPGGDRVVRRAARTATRLRADLIGVHVRSQDGLDGGDATDLDAQRRLLEEFGGTFVQPAGADVATTLVDMARAENATRVVLGATSRSPVRELIRGSVVNRVLRLSRGEFDVAVIGDRDEPAPRGTHRLRTKSRRRAISSRRRWIGVAIAAIGIPALTVLLVLLESVVSLSGVLLLYLGLSVGVAAVGGVWPALATAASAFLVVNWYFTLPVHTFTISRGENLLALVIFLAVALVVSVFVELSARRALDGAAAKAEAETIARLAGARAAGGLLESLARALGVDGATVFRRDGDALVVDAQAGDHPPQHPEDASATIDLDGARMLATTGTPPQVEERVLHAFTRELAVSLERDRLEREAAGAEELARAGELRAALLAAVSHDLRTPLAAIRAAVTSLMEPDVTWSKEDVDDFHATIDAAAQRLDGLLGNLLDMSRIQAGAIIHTERPVALDEVVPAALVELGEKADDVTIDVPETLPLVVTDAGLLERVIANLVDNAIVHTPPGTRVRVEAAESDDRVEIRVIDDGPGLAPGDRERVFEPFQRTGDGHGGAGGVGLGLAGAKGFVDAMDGRLSVADTPGGGTTMVVRLRSGG